MYASDKPEAISGETIASLASYQIAYTASAVSHSPESAEREFKHSTPVRVTWSAVHKPGPKCREAFRRWSSEPMCVCEGGPLVGFKRANKRRPPILGV